MNTRRCNLFLRALSPAFLVGLGLLAPISGRATDLYWVPDAGGNWSVASNWFNSQPPTNSSGADSVYIHYAPYLIAGSTGSFVTTITAPYTIQSLFSGASLTIGANGVLTLQGGGSTIAKGLTITSGQLLGPGGLTVDGLLTFGLGTIGAGSQLTLNGGVAFTGGSSRTIARDVLLDSDGSFEGGNLIATGSNFVIAPGRTLTFESGTWYEGALIVNGLLRKSASSATVSVGNNYSNGTRSVTNSGFVEVLGGRLTIAAAGTHTGDFDVSSGATLQWSANADLTATSATTGAGVVQFSNGTQTFASGSTFSANAEFAGSVVNFQPGSVLLNTTDLKLTTGTVNLNTGSAKTYQTLTMSGGEIDGADNLAFSGDASMTSGTIKGSGTLTFHGSALLGGSGTKTVLRPVLVNGPLTTLGTAILGSSPVTIASGVEWSIPGTHTWYEGNTTLNGVLTKSGSGIASVGSNYNSSPRSFVNNNLVQVLGGTLGMRASGTHVGDFTVAQAATLVWYADAVLASGSSTSGLGLVQFSIGTQTFEGGSSLSTPMSFSGSTVNFQPGSTLQNLTSLEIGSGAANFNTGAAKAFQTLTMTGGTVGGVDDLSFSGSASMTGGTIQGPGTLTFNGLVSLGGSGTKRIERGTQVNGNLTTSGTVNLSSSPVTIASGVEWSIPGAFTWYEGNTTLNGVLTKSGSGTASIAQNYNNAARSFVNNNLVRALGGTLAIRATNTHPGDFEVGAGAELHLYENQTFAAGSAVSGSGKVDVKSGSHTWQSGSSVAAEPVFSGGSATFLSGSALSWTGDLVIDNCTVSLSTGMAKTFAAGSLAGGTLTGSDDLTFSQSLTWSGGTISGPGIARFNDGIAFTGTGTRTLDRPTILGGASTIAGGSVLAQSSSVELVEGSSLTTNNVAWYESHFVNNGTLVFDPSSTANWCINYNNSPRSFTNNGLVKALRNRANIKAAGTHTGDFEIASGAQITLEQDHTFAAGSAVKGQGLLELFNGTMAYQSGSSVETPLEVSSANATFEPGSNLANPTALTIGTGSLTLNTGSPRSFSSLTMGSGKLQGSDEMVVQGDCTMAGSDVVAPGKITVEKRLDMLVAASRTWRGTIDLKGRTELGGGSLLTLEGCDVKIYPGSEFWLSGSSLMLYEGEYVNEGAIRRPAFAGTNYARLGANHENGPRSIDNQGLIEALGNLQLESEVKNYSPDTQRLTGGTWRVGDGATLKILAGVNVLTNAADVEFLGPNALFTNSSNAYVFAGMDENQGSFRLMGGKTHTRNGNFLNGGLIETDAASTFAATGQYRQTNGNTIVGGNHDSASFSLEGGNLIGTGTVGAPVANAGGVVSGGASVGQLNLLYTYAQSSSGTMLAELQGTGAGQHDLVDVAGNVALGGALEVRMMPGYVADQGDTFRILTSGASVSGTFDVEPDAADWTVSYGANYVDVTANRQVFSPVTVSGKVTLMDFQASSAGVTIDVEVRQGGSVVQSVTVPLLEDGSYSFATTRRDDAEVSVKSSHWLRRTVTGINFTDSGVQGLDFSLINGDVDGDNVVTVFDYNLLSDAFDSVEGDANWNRNADLDGDGSVTVFDYNILSANFDQVGDD